MTITLICVFYRLRKCCLTRTNASFPDDDIFVDINNGTIGQYINIRGSEILMLLTMRKSSAKGVPGESDDANRFFKMQFGVDDNDGFVDRIPVCVDEKEWWCCKECCCQLEL